jgi:glycosyltransferase involved in cell wall biosynthesis
MKKKVLYVFSNLSKTGPVNIIYNILLFINRNHYTPIILTLSSEDNKKPSSKEEYKALGVDIIELNLTRRKGFFKAKTKILDLCLKENIDTIHLVGFRADIIVKGFRFKNLNIISSIFSNLFDDYRMLYGKRTGWVMAYLHMKSLRNKIAVACSSFVKEELNKYCPAREFITIRNSVSMNKFFVPNISSKLQIRQQLGLPPDSLIFIFVGVLIDRKDPLTTIKGFMASQLFKAGNTKLLILGDGPLRAACEDVSEGNKDVIFYGNTSQTLSYLHASDYYVASSLSEGLPTSVIEAIACGIPPILSAIPPHQEILQFYRDQVRQFSKKDVVQLAEVIDSLDLSGRDEESMRWRQIAENEFNAELMSKKYQSLY